MAVYPVALEVLAMKAKHSNVARWFILLLLVGILSTGLAPMSTAKPAADDLPSKVGSGATISLRTASGATIPFTTWNGHSVDGVPPETRKLPHLVLYRNGTLADSDERTLLVEVSGLEVPPAGLTVTLELMTMHGDPDPGDNLGQQIPIWRASRRIPNTSGITQTNVATAFVHTFAETVESANRTIPTPTDYGQYEVTVTA
ncbi:MAG: hypothetical protein AB8I80_06765, partial [Anaerolineae bacterium]